MLASIFVRLFVCSLFVDDFILCAMRLNDERSISFFRFCCKHREWPKKIPRVSPCDFRFVCAFFLCVLFNVVVVHVPFSFVAFFLRPCSLCILGFSNTIRLCRCKACSFIFCESARTWIIRQLKRINWSVFQNNLFSFTSGYLHSALCCHAKQHRYSRSAIAMLCDPSEFRNASRSSSSAFRPNE